jgi:integrase
MDAGALRNAAANGVAARRWPDLSPNHRRGIADVLTALLAEQMPTDPDKAMVIRSALKNWAFNIRRGSAAQPAAVTAHLEWVARKSPQIGDLADSRLLRPVLDSFKVNLNGKRAAGRTAAWRRSVFSTVMNHAVDEKLLASNPGTPVRGKKAKPKEEAIDRRSVPNPSQARNLLNSVGKMPRSGKRMVAFFGCIYFAALRPEEAVELRRRNLDLPAEGWGWINLERASPEVDKHWSDSGVIPERSGAVKCCD